MKRNKLFAVIVLSSLLLFPASNNAEVKIQKSNLEKAFISFPDNLESSFPGIVESTIYNIIFLKKYQPEADYSDFVKRLNKLAAKDSDASIRYKAHLASIFISFSDLIDIQNVQPSDDHDVLFNQIAEQLKNKLLAVK